MARLSAKFTTSVELVDLPLPLSKGGQLENRADGTAQQICGDCSEAPQSWLILLNASRMRRLGRHRHSSGLSADRRESTQSSASLLPVVVYWQLLYACSTHTVRHLCTVTKSRTSQRLVKSLGCNQRQRAATRSQWRGQQRVYSKSVPYEAASTMSTGPQAPVTGDRSVHPLSSSKDTTSASSTLGAAIFAVQPLSMGRRTQPLLCCPRPSQHGVGLQLRVIRIKNRHFSFAEDIIRIIEGAPIEFALVISVHNLLSSRFPCGSEKIPCRSGRHEHSNSQRFLLKPCSSEHLQPAELSFPCLLPIHVSSQLPCTTFTSATFRSSKRRWTSAQSNGRVWLPMRRFLVATAASNDTSRRYWTSQIASHRQRAFQRERWLEGTPRQDAVQLAADSKAGRWMGVP